MWSGTVEQIRIIHAFPSTNRNRRWSGEEALFHVIQVPLHSMFIYRIHVSVAVLAILAVDKDETAIGRRR
jgi:hypothetical protein